MVLILGPRHAGKITLVRKMEKAGRTYTIPNDRPVPEAARPNPSRFIRGLDRAIIDEIQHARDL